MGYVYLVLQLNKFLDFFILLSDDECIIGWGTKLSGVASPTPLTKLEVVKIWYFLKHLLLHNIFGFKDSCFLIIIIW